MNKMLDTAQWVFFHLKREWSLDKLEKPQTLKT